MKLLMGPAHKDLFFKLQVEIPVTSTPPPFCPPRKCWPEQSCDWLEISLDCDMSY